MSLPLVAGEFHHKTTKKIVNLHPTIIDFLPIWVNRGFEGAESIGTLEKIPKNISSEIWPQAIFEVGVASVFLTAHSFDVMAVIFINLFALCSQ